MGGVVVGVENPPGLEIGDSALDSVADLTDDSVPFVVSPVRVPAWWLTPGGIHSGAGAASVACAGAPRHGRQLSLGCVQQAGGLDGRPRPNSSKRSHLVHRGITEEV